MKLLYKKLRADAVAPAKGKKGDSGFDVVANNFVELFVLKNGQEYKVSADEFGVLPEVTVVKATGLVNEKTNRPIPAPDCIFINPGERAVIGTGLACTVQSDDGKVYELQARPRSGAARNKGLTVLNTPGTVDSIYRGELCIILINLSGIAQKVKLGDRIAQIVPAEVPQPELEEVTELDETERGAHGFGSSGV